MEVTKGVPSDWLQDYLKIMFSLVILAHKNSSMMKKIKKEEKKDDSSYQKYYVENWSFM